MKRIDNISSSIIAGGKSKRFGQDKSLYGFKGRPLIEHVIDTLREIFKEIVIITNEGKKFSYLNLPTFPDIITDLGPIGGIYTALKYSKTEKTFIVACDMPYLNSDLIKYMVSISDGYDIVVPFVNNYFEALHAIYSTNCLDPIERLISNGGRQIIAFFDDVKIRKVTEDEIIHHADIDKIFENINYKEDV